MTLGTIKSILDLLNQYRTLIKNNRDLGTSFELLIKSYLEHDPINADRYAKVSMWSEWEHKWGPDCGIDLVAEDKAGKFIAIQCKFYDPNYELKKEDINSFLAESSKTFKIKGKQKSFSQRIIFSTSDNWSNNADNSIVDQNPPVNRVHIRELEQSTIDWSKYRLDKPEKLTFKEKKKTRPHQVEAITKVIAGFEEHDRGKLIMACGTGKTFTALKLTERFVKKDGVVLFLVPSISLLSQTLREWTAESENPFHAFAVCSDNKVGKDSEDISKHELLIPATTDTKSLIKGIETAKGDNRWIVIFSTYQSIDVVSQAQKKGLPDFDLVICDEAHRTTGVTLVDQDESHFVKVHDQKFIKAAKRLYMTATPRVFGDAVKTKASEAGAILCDMGDEKLFGPEFHRLGFGKAVSENLLTDYKVLVLAVDERVIDAKFQKNFANDNNELPLEDIAKIIGCWNGLSKRFVGEEAVVENNKPMKRAVAFTRSIKDSKRIAHAFEAVVKEYSQKNGVKESLLDIEAHHVDGSFNVLKRNAELDWLKEEALENSCRILSNARCLSEGVDVPALDAVLFLNSRDSQVDVVQSVGRIMRRAEGKKYGYIILPVGIPAGMAPDEALKDNKKYKVVWQVLQALRAHDDRFNAVINQMDLNKKRPSNIQIIGVGGGESGEGVTGANGPQQINMNFPEIEEWRDSIYAKIVLKCGSRPYWENWAADVAKIAEKHSENIKKLLKTNESKSKKEFLKFLEGIRKNINPSISEDDAIEMLSQHLITKPIFDALFEHYPFTDKNPVSRSMQSVLKALESDSFKEDSEKLKSFYDSVRIRVKGIDNAEGRQRIIVELYDRFFKVAFPKMADRLGIVYTPIEVVDFIISSVESVLKKEFDKSLSDKDVHILDPFTGTGTFIVRLLQSGIIKKEDLKRKFTNELHANEIVLLAYYIAAINIEETFYGICDGGYTPFDGIVLTDTFQLAEDDAQKTFEIAMPENGERVIKQKKTSIQVIMSNPPYSAGQRDANDNNQNLDYPKLDARIEETYAKESTATNINSLYDSYIRAIRWATDRIGDSGVVGFVTNGSFLESNAADGLRKSFGKELAKIYCFNLRGNQRTSGELSRKEGGKIFGSGSRTPVAITILIKDLKYKEECKINYYDIGDYLSREEKLLKIKGFGSVDLIPWNKIAPNECGDWVKKRSDEFTKFPSLSSDTEESIFEIRSRGAETNRDNWVYSFSLKDLRGNVNKFVSTYNSDLDRFLKLKRKEDIDLDSFVTSDRSLVSWSRGLKKSLKSEKTINIDSSRVFNSLYRPYSKQFLHFQKEIVEYTNQMPKIFPTPVHKNIVIAVTGIGASKGFSTLIIDVMPNLHFQDTGQCFPLNIYERFDKDLLNGMNLAKDGFVQRDAISDWALKLYQSAYNDKQIKKVDIFYYIYGVLHSPIYRENFQNDLKKMLPRIPLCRDFWGFSKAGRSLADWHLQYEVIEPYPLKEELKEVAPKKAKELYQVNESGMKWPKEKKVEDKTRIIFNQFVTLSGIPIETYDYVVNGKSALEWIMERYRVTIDLNAKGEGSGIKNDPNEWSDDPRYIVDLVKRIVRVSLETNKIVNNLPELDIISEN